MERAHSLAGSLGTLGAHHAGRLCRALMEAARQGDAGAVGRHSAAALQALRAVEEALAALLDGEQGQASP